MKSNIHIFLDQYQLFPCSCNSPRSTKQKKVKLHEPSIKVCQNIYNNNALGLSSSYKGVRLINQRHLNFCKENPMKISLKTKVPSILENLL